MSFLLVASCYGSAALLALFALWHFGVKHWWWHAGSIALALGVGLVRFPEPFNQPSWTLVVGWVFVFFFLWGVAAPVVAALRHPPHFHFRQRH
jgi:hypothetical protein